MFIRIIQKFRGFSMIVHLGSIFCVAVACGLGDPVRSLGFPAVMIRLFVPIPRGLENLPFNLLRQRECFRSEQHRNVIVKNDGVLTMLRSPAVCKRCPTSIHRVLPLVAVMPRL